MNKLLLGLSTYILLNICISANGQTQRTDILNNNELEFYELVAQSKNQPDTLVYYIKQIESKLVKSRSAQNLYLLNELNSWLAKSFEYEQMSNFDSIRTLWASCCDTNHIEYLLTYQTQSSLFLKRRMYQKTIDLLEHCLNTINKHYPNFYQQEKLSILTSLAYSNTIIQNSTQAINYTIRLQEVAKKLNNYESLARSYNTLGHAFRYISASQSQLNFEQSIKLINQYKLEQLEYIKMNSAAAMSEIALQNKEYNLALQYTLINKNSIPDESKANPAQLLNLYMSLGDIYSAMDSIDKSNACFNTCDSLCTIAYGPNSTYAYYIKSKRNDYYIRHKQYDIAIPVYEEIIQQLNLMNQGQLTSLLRGMKLRLATMKISVGDYNGYQTIIDSAIYSVVNSDERNVFPTIEQIDNLANNDINFLWECFHLKASEISHKHDFNYTTEKALNLLNTTTYLLNKQFSHISDNSIDLSSLMYSDLVNAYFDFFSDKNLTQEQLRNLWFNTSMTKSYKLVFQIEEKNDTSQFHKNIRDIDEKLSANKNNTRLIDSLRLKRLDYSNLAFLKNAGNSTKKTVNLIDYASIKNELNNLINNSISNNQVVDVYAYDSVIYSYIIKNGEIELNQTRIDDNIEAITKSIKRSIKTGNTTNKYQVFNPIFNKCNPSINNLLIISHESLQTIPFELVTYNNQYLIESFNIQYGYSPFLSLETNMERVQNNQSILIAAPVFNKTDPPYNAIAYREIESLSKQHNLNITKENNITPLPYTKSEYKEIAKLFNQYKKNVTGLIDEQANESDFKRNCFNASITHIATHGIVSNTNYNDNRLLFYTAPNTDSPDDGILYFDEIYNLNINSDLVVLSACKTGVGQIKKGEGIMALPRGFIYAGVPNVIASLWKVHDKNTKDFMVLFYNNLLKQNLSYAQALRKTKIEFIKKGYSPVDWASFVLIGE